MKIIPNSDETTVETTIEAINSVNMIVQQFYHMKFWDHGYIDVGHGC